MAYSRVVAIGDGHTKQFSVNFALDYLLEADVTCRVGSEVDGSGAPIYRAITFLSTNLIDVAGAPAGDGVQIIFERTVDKNRLRVDYNNGDQLDEDNLMVAQKQAMMAVHEVLDGRFGVLTEDLDVGGHKVVNSAEPVLPTDVATKNYVDGFFGEHGLFNPDAYYDKLASDDRYYVKTQVYNRTEIDNSFFNTTQSDYRYYTKTQSDENILSALNIRNPVAGGYTVQESDHGKTVAGTGALGTIAILPTANYTRTNFMLRIVNENMSRGQKIVVDGFAPFILYPGMSVLASRSGSVWIVERRNERFKLGDVGGVVQFYVDPVNGTAGVGNTDGLAGSGPGAFKYIQDAINNIIRFIDCNNNLPVVKVISQVNGEQILSSFAGQPMGSCQILIRGGTGASPVRWIATANNQTFVQARDNGILTIDGFDFDCQTFTGCCALNPSQQGTIDYANCWFGPCIGGTHINVMEGGSLNNLDDGSGNNYKVYGLSAVGSGTHWTFTAPCKFNMGGVTIQIPNGLQFDAFLRGTGPGFVSLGFNYFSGPGAGAGSVGRPFALDRGFVVSINGTVFPGNASPVANNGAQAY
jgi:Phage T7 tail fibre protein